MSRFRSRVGPTLIAVALAVGIGTVYATPAVAGVPAMKQLPIAMQIQQKSKWCWVAVGATIASYYGDGITQNSFCNLAKGTSGTCPNNAGSAAYVQSAFSQLGYVSPGDDYKSFISYADVRKEILANRPFYAGVSWTSGGGHAVVVYGFMDDDGFLGRNSIFYATPTASHTRYNLRDYTYFKSNKDYAWTRTLDNIRRK